MDKNKIMNILPVLLPLAAVVLAALPNAVTIYAPGMDPVSCAFFTLVEDVEMSVCMPFSAIFGAVCFGLAVIWMVKKTPAWMQGVAVTAFVSMTLAVLPILMRTETYIVPNMLVPILMGLECLLAYGLLKKPREEEKPKSKRLGDRK